MTGKTTTPVVSHEDRMHLLALQAFAHEHKPTTFWRSCFLCEHRTYLRQLSERAQ